jgi:O-antigen/teichoic acid export membrane protein
VNVSAVADATRLVELAPLPALKGRAKFKPPLRGENLDLPGSLDGELFGQSRLNSKLHHYLPKLSAKFVSSQLSLSISANESVSPAQLRRSSSRKLSELILYGSATLGLAVGLERVLGFVSGVLAARIAGPQTFGAYSMVLATAGTIAAYAGAGIGTTATRFSGQYKPETSGYRRFLLALVVIALSSAVVAALLMLAGAGPLARWVLRNEGLVSFLRIAAASSAAIVLLECCRGLLLGQRKFQALLIVSVVSGLGLIFVLPLAARISAGVMIGGQAIVSLVCVAIVLVLSKRIGLLPVNQKASDAGPGIRPVFTFGLVQFAAFAGVSIASWWIASLVARSDVSLTQMGLYAIANQFRGLAALAPGLCAQVGYSLLTDESGSEYGGANRVMLMNSFLAGSLATVAASFGIVFAPWLLAIVYGKSFSGAETAIVILLATGIVHMSSIPAAQRLSIVGLRAMGIINTIWAILTAILGIWLIPKAGATGAALAFLISHTLSQVLVIIALARVNEVPNGYLSFYSVLTF